MLLLPLLLPFLLGAAAAWIVRRPAAGLQRLTKLPGKLCGAACVLLLYLLLGAGAFLLLRRLLFELGRLSGELPELLTALSGPMERLQGFLRELAERVPDGLGHALETAVDGFFASSAELTSRLTSSLFQFTGRLFAALPDLLLFFLTMLLSSFMFSCEWDQLGPLIRARLPQKWQDSLRPVLSRLGSALRGWLRAQGKLMLITFCLLTAGLLLLKIEYALLLGALIALIDALPLLGTGTILIPWALAMLLRGQASCGLGLLLLYGAATLTRSVLEPRLVGSHLGLHPLLALFAMYAGYRLFSFPGLVLFPIGAGLVGQLAELLRAS